MKMEKQITDKIDRGIELFESGYSCSQSVVLAFADHFGIDSSVALKFSSSFGAGMGRLREVCGAATGMFMILGWLYPYENVEDKEAKKVNYAAVQRCAVQFKERMGSYICAELLKIKREPQIPVPSDRTDAYYNLRPCTRAVAVACEIVAKEIFKDA